MNAAVSIEPTLADPARAASGTRLLDGRSPKNLIVGFAVVLALIVAATIAIRWAGTPQPAAAGAAKPVKLEPVVGSSVKRITLTAQAAERLGIQLGKVGSDAIVRRQVVGGVVVPPMVQVTSADGSVSVATTSRVALARTGGPAPAAPTGFADFTTFGNLAAPASTAGGARTAAGGAGPAAAPRALAPASGEVWLMLSVSPAEYERIAPNEVARVIPLARREGQGRAASLLARPSGMAPMEDSKRSMVSLYYALEGRDLGLALNERVRVELKVAGDGVTRSVVPYSALYYDAKGGAWVYVNPAPLTFQREAVEVEGVQGDTVVLARGPATGTAVVTTGAPLLYGTEIFGK